MKTHPLAVLIVALLIPISAAQDKNSIPAELTPAYPRDQRVNVATQQTSGTLRQRPGRPEAPPRPLLDSIARWREFDEKLVEASRRFAENSAHRNELMKSLAQTKDRASTQMDPASIIARKEVERLLGELHTVIEADKGNNDQAVRLLRQAITNRERWAAALTKVLDQSLGVKDVPAAERDRMRRWREGIAKLQEDNNRDFIKQIVGNSYGDYLVNSNPTLARLRQPDPVNPAMRGGLEGDGRGFWLNRIGQIERAQAALRQQLNRQDQEIARIKMMLENREREGGNQRTEAGDRGTRPMRDSTEHTIAEQATQK